MFYPEELSQFFFFFRAGVAVTYIHNAPRERISPTQKKKKKKEAAKKWSSLCTYQRLKFLLLDAKDFAIRCTLNGTVWRVKSLGGSKRQVTGHCGSFFLPVKKQLVADHAVLGNGPRMRNAYTIEIDLISHSRHLCFFPPELFISF